ncbi:phospholipid/cholesterol/gamma-HCH transport system substrate-binding protein [Rhodococcus sp. AG1013]|uniref:MCE family protein n=1 Tax=Rhodococcus sp. AG1013 TaxID=2183996 RepID=UPI000E0C8658|nr:MCE family protein [Rhodococcus sp. AG1013]RDI28156.1 phospholipid/cholesterol/gamma-HCH transport system substrate-binding protein [Rhodococcus sp. AG1013]
MKVAWVPLAKVIGFCAVGVVCASLVANTLSVPVHGATERYTVEFTDVEGLNQGNPVTMSGVRVGRVDSIEFADAGGGTSKAVVGIEVSSDYPLDRNVTAAVRYGDMLGARYLALTPPPGGAVEAVAAGTSSEALAPGGVVPLERTTPPVDLTALMNGFAPLFDALDPAEVNALTRGFVETFDGGGATVATLLDRIGTLTTDLANRRGVFEELLSNMSTLMGSVNSRQLQLEELVTGLRDLSTSVAGSNDQLAALLDNGNRAVASLADALTHSQGAFGSSITDLTSVTDAWIADTDAFERFVAQMPQFADGVNRISSYGGFVSLYLCNFVLKVGDVEANIFGTTHSEVCR